MASIIEINLINLQSEEMSTIIRNLEFWETIRDEMRPLLAKEEFGAGLALGVRRIGEALAIYFPYQREDVNELSDELSYGE